VLDLQSESGRETARRLALGADVLLENFAPGVTERLGIGPEAACAANPGLVYVSLSGFGHTGPWRDRRSFGHNIEAASSLLARTGYPGEEPLRMGQTLPDGVGGVVGALTALRGLRERDERGGRGGWYDVSQLEVYAAISGEEILQASRHGAWPGRVGNRSRQGAIKGVFPCLGEDQWVVIRLSDGDDLKRFIGATGLTNLATAAEAPRDDEAIEVIIAAYTQSQDKHRLAEALQAEGIEALPVLTATELFADPHLRERSFFERVELGGRHFEMPGHPFHSDQPVADCKAALASQ
jgi:crotonobetainyl-CoA:carnitine CoA-transferase CaiB-like acyl-CoA transferase